MSVSSPEKCDEEVFRTGTHVFLTHSIPRVDVEWWVKKVATESGQRVDWHYVGGRVNVLALGDIRLVKNAITRWLPVHDALLKIAMDRILGGPPVPTLEEEAP